MANLVRWLGHASVYLETAGFKVLIDPFFTGNPAASVTADKVKADFILVSHGHGDHIGDAIDIAKRTGATIITNYEISEWLTGKGVQKVHGQQHGGCFNHPFGRVKFTLAFHGSMLPDGSYGGNPCGFLIYLRDGKKIYHAADTGLFGDMKIIGQEGIDLAILPIGDNYTMGPEDALRAVHFVQPKKVLPIHYNTWPIIAQDAQAWGNRVQRETQTHPVILKPGEALEL